MKITLEQLKSIIKEEVIDAKQRFTDRQTPTGGTSVPHEGITSKHVMAVYDAAVEAAEACRVSGEFKDMRFFRSVIDKCIEIRRNYPGNTEL